MNTNPDIIARNKNYEPQIPLSEALELARWATMNYYEWIPERQMWESFTGLGMATVYYYKTDSELLEIFRSGKEKE